MGNPYAKLFVSEDVTSDEQVLTALDGLVRLTRGRDSVVPGERFERLSVTQKLVAYALARYALARSGEFPGAQPAAESKEYARAIGADIKTCRDLLCRLQRRHILVKDGPGYAVQPAGIPKAVKALDGNSVK